MSIKFKLIENQSLNDRQLKQIIDLKEQYWSYDYISQKKWIELNFLDRDMHLLLYLDEIPIAYTGINLLNCVVDDKVIQFLGLGNVCVDHNYLGNQFGKKVVEISTNYIMKKSKPGMLLCHNHLLPFYLKCGWEELGYKKAFVQNREFNEKIMTISYDKKEIYEIIIEKNF